MTQLACHTGVAGRLHWPSLAEVPRVEFLIVATFFTLAVEITTI